MVKEMTPKQQADFDRAWAEFDEYFDWAKVHKVMKALKWTWLDGGVPTTLDMKVTAKDLLRHLIVSPRGVTGTGTGGFYVSRSGNGKKESPVYELSFIVEWWEAGHGQ